jgi:hypothetical protein
MGDAEPLKSSSNGRTEAEDPPPTQSSAGTPASAIGGSSVTAVDSVHVSDVSPNEDDVPPAKRARKFSDADQASVHQAVVHVSPPCLVRHRRRANIVIFRRSPCKEFPCTRSRECHTRKWRITSFNPQCSSAQIRALYNSDTQKAEGCCSFPFSCRSGGFEDTSLSSGHQAPHGLFHH